MPIVHVPEKGTRQKINSCKTAPPYGTNNSGDYTTVEGYYKSLEDIGTIWECPDCGNFLVTVKRGRYLQWRTVRWYMLEARGIVNDLRRERLDTRGSVL